MRSTLRFVRAAAAMALLLVAHPLRAQQPAPAAAQSKAKAAQPAAEAEPQPAASEARGAQPAVSKAKEAQPAAGSKAKGAAPTAARKEQREVIKGRVLPVELDIRRLPNGLTVALVPYDSPGLVAYFTAMRVGSRDEVEAGHSGFAHLFEHIMFRGTKKLPGPLYDRKAQSLGADSSAWTSTDQTMYSFIAPTAALPEVIAMEADRFQNLYYAEREFKTESGAVLGEYNKNFSDPANQLEEDLMNLAFERSTYKHTTMGFLKDIKAMPGMFGYSRSFFRRHYVPAKALIFVVGDFDREAVMDNIAREYGKWVRPAKEARMPVEPEQKKERRKHRAWKQQVLPQLMVGYKIPAYSTETADHAALTLIGEMLFGKTGPLYRKLVLEDQLAERVEFWDWPHRDAALWTFSAKLKRSEFDAVLRELDQALQEVSAGKVTQERLDAVKSHYRYAFVLGLDTPRSLAQQLAIYATLDGDPAGAESYLEQIGQVTLEDLQRVAKSFLVSSRRTVVTLAHEEGPAKQGGK